MTKMPSTHRREDWLELWEGRELPFLTALPYILLVLCAVFDIATGHGIKGPVVVDLGLCAAAALAMAIVDLRDDRSAWTDPLTGVSTAPAAALFLALVAIFAVLVAQQPLYGFYTWTGYFWAWRLLKGRARLVGVALVAAVTAVSQTGSGPYNTAFAVIGLIVVYLVNASIAGALTWFGWVGNEQHRRRADEVSALSAANAKLEASLQHNADLQAQLLAQARDAGVIEERRRMAREIHDTIAQGLMGIITQLQAAQGAAASSSDTTDHAVVEHQPGERQPAERHVETAIEMARESLREARRSVNALAPEPLAGARLPDAIADIAGRWSDLHNIPAAFVTTGTPRLMRPEIELALLRTAQEALANVAKHAHAARVGLTLSYMQDVVTLDVRDDGTGFVTVNGSGPRRPVDDQGGFGLAAMRERLAGVAGTLEIESEPGQGTAISAAIPAVVLGDGR